MTTLLVGLENTVSKNPTDVLLPTCSPAAKGIVELIRRRVADYSVSDYEHDFLRTALYPASHAPKGKGTSRQDRDAAGHVYASVLMARADEVVLIGQRVNEAFRDILAEPCRPLQYGLSPEIAHTRFWYLPAPVFRNYWYNHKCHAEAAAKLMERLRHRRIIPYREARA